MARILMRVPKAAKRGEVFEIRALISHRMEPGYRRTRTGKRIPQDIIHHFVATYNGEMIFEARLYPAIAANPFISFFTEAVESGTIELAWTGDKNFKASRSAQIEVT
jgi:sulfur-oxidizing protein SoxZ